MRDFLKGPEKDVFVSLSRNPGKEVFEKNMRKKRNCWLLTIFQFTKWFFFYFNRGNIMPVRLFLTRRLDKASIFVAFVEDNATMSSIGYFENLCKPEGSRP